MAAAKPETLIFSEIRHKNCCGFACMQHMIENPTAIPTCVGTRFPRELLTTLFVVHGSQKSKMADAKPEVLVSQLLHEILTKFQRLPPHNRGSAFQWSCCEYCRMKPEARNPRWRPPNRKYLYIGSYTQLLLGRRWMAEATSSTAIHRKSEMATAPGTGV